MYLNILKKDLKRKKTMNVIILLFIVLSTLFVSSSVNNILAVFKGLDGYFAKAGVPDHIIVTMDKNYNGNIEDVLDEIKEIDSYGTEKIIFMNENNIKIKDAGSSFIEKFSEVKLNLFGENNKKITELHDGQIMMPVKSMNDNKLKVGDHITITIGDVTKDFVIAGKIKDAAFGSALMGSTRIIMSDSDFDAYANEEYSKLFSGKIVSIKTSDSNAVKDQITSLNTLFDAPSDTMKLTYLPDMIIAGVILVVSLLLIITAFIVLRFTIGYTVSEEFREIGVMKAIGIKNSRIRILYIIKYIALAAAGAFIGFWGSIPLSNLLLNSVTKTIVLESENSMLINVICSLSIIAIIFLFSYGCTRKVKKFTPLDAIRSGQTGERFRKKSIIHLGKSKLSPKSFLAVNDILSSPKRYGTIVLIILLCLSPVLVCANTANTLKSPRLLPAFGTLEADAMISPINGDIPVEKIMSDNGKEMLNDYMKKLEKDLDGKGMPSNCFIVCYLKPTITHNDKKANIMITYDINTTADSYHYDKGTPPQNENEIALTHLSAKQLGVSIGDTVTVSFNEGDKEMIVTALYQSMNNLGISGKLHENTEFSFRQLSGMAWIQVDFTDSPSKKEIKSRIGKLSDIYGEDKVFTASQIVKETTGMGDSVDYVKYLSLVLACIISALVAILMERSFVAKERSELAMLKAIGFKTKQIRARHCIRMGITAFLGVTLSAMLSSLLTKLTIDPVFKMMGAVNGVEYDISPLENFVIYPVIIFAVTVIFTYIASQSIRKIKTSEVSGIE